MPRRPKRRRNRGTGFVVIAILAIAAVFVGRSLLRPLSHGTHRHVATATLAPPPAVVARATEPPATPTAAAAASAAPSAAETATSMPATNGPKLALIVDDCGQWIDTERAFVALPIPLTLSVLPDVRYNTVISKDAVAAGKGVMLHLPMETVSGVYPGPGEVTTEMTDAQVAAQVEHDLAAVPLAQGVNNHEGSKATADLRVMDVVAATIARKDPHLFFIDSRTAADSVAQEAAVAAGLPSASRDVFLDNRDDVAYVEGQLRQAAEIARRNGSAIAIGHPRAATLAAVRALYPELERDGITFVLAQSLTARSR